MNEASANYLNSLQNSRVKMAEILNSKNVEASPDEPLNELIDKAELIHGGVEFGKWIPTVNTESLIIGGLKFLPCKIGISCEALAGQSMYGEAMRYISLFAANNDDETASVYAGKAGEVSFSNVPTGAAVTVTLEPDGTYTVLVDFSEYNQITDIAYCFKGGYEYMWVTAIKEWSI